MFPFLYTKFTQDNMYQMLSESVRFCRRYVKKHFGVFSVHSVVLIGFNPTQYQKESSKNLTENRGFLMKTELKPADLWESQATTALMMHCHLSLPMQTFCSRRTIKLRR